MLQPWMIPSDLAPGDRRSEEGDFPAIDLHRVRSTETPEFQMAYEHLWQAFGPGGEIEQPEILSARMAWEPAIAADTTHSMLYEMALLTLHGDFVAVRDHTAIACLDSPAIVVHMSHNLVAPEHRRSGIAGWLRALPLQSARRCRDANHLPENTPVTLVGEMEPADPQNESRSIRLAAYEKAGYRKVDPVRVPYLQPDFRAFTEIDRDGGPHPIPLSLLVRRLGRESEVTIGGREVQTIVRALYTMYGKGFRAADMRAVWDALAHYPEESETIDLLPPTAP